MLIDSAGRQTLVDAIRARDVRRIVYFHADHFEPWKPFSGRAAISPLNCEDLVNFADRVKRIDFARRLTLFYKAHVTQTTDLAQSGVRKAAPDDIFGFVERPAAQREMARAGMSHLISATHHEIQVHIHHENFTNNESHKDPRMIAFFANPDHAAHDEQRLDLAIRLWLEAIKADTDLDLCKWFFVHGLWALNASDPKVCKINNEIQILMKHGCQGDFTFPAGRKSVDPKLEEPFFIRPIDAHRCYDLPEAQPEAAYGHGGPGKFFIWNSKIKHTSSSIDYYAPWLRKKLEDIKPFALDIINQSHVVDGTLWFKTHAHSLHQSYSEETRIPIFPHEHPHIQVLIGSVLDAGAAAGAEIAFWTASEVYEAFSSGEVEKATTCQRNVPLEACTGELHRHAAQIEQPPSVSNGVSDSKTTTDAPKDTALINTTVVDAVRRQIEALGEAESGTGAYYRIRADRGCVLMRYETALVAHLLAAGDTQNRVFEIGSGVGALPMLLAANGIESIGIEADRRRSQIAENALHTLKKTRPDIAAKCRLVTGRFPQAASDELGSDIAITTNIITTLSADDTESFMRGLTRFRRVLIDVSRFLVARNTASEQKKLIEHFARLGLRGAELSFDLGAEGVYWSFSKH